MVSQVDRSLVWGIFLIFGVSQVLALSNIHVQHLSERLKTEIQKNVKEELELSNKYLALSAHFNKEKVNRPGLAKYFKESSEKNFERAQKLIDYLNKRGFSILTDNLKLEAPLKISWNDGVEALSDALDMEGRLMNKLTSLHESGKSDGHFTNFLETEFLEDQVNTMWRLSGFYNNLEAMTDPKNPTGNELAEYLFDRQLLGEKPEL